jgi:hypothetical protein
MYQACMKNGVERNFEREECNQMDSPHPEKQVPNEDISNPQKGSLGYHRYSRQISALSLILVSSSRITWALNSGVNVRRFGMAFPLSWTDST